LGRNAFNLVSSASCAWLECEAFTRIPWLIHAFSTRCGDSRSLSKPGTKPVAALTAGQRGFLAELGAEGFRLASLQQRHTAIIYFVSSRGRSSSLHYGPSGYPSSTPAGKPRNPAGDALITEFPKILLTVRVADCLPVLLADPKKRAVAAVHAGWRGALNRIVEKAAGEMRRVFHSKPENLIAAIGPSIRACCYEVGEEVVEAFRGKFALPENFFRTGLTVAADQGAGNRRFPLFFTQVPPGHQAKEHSGIYLDLVAIARSQLELAGVPTAQIHVADYCTSCRNDLFYSYRKEGSRAGRMLAVIGIRAGG
jgi:YfiH family protein